MSAAPIERKSAVSPMPPETPADPATIADFKGAMRHLAAGVCLVTAGRGEGRRGLTATAVCSVSMDPPTLLACVNRGGEAHRAITAAGAFCVNLLSADDEAEALAFAGQGGRLAHEKFAARSWSELATGAPALDGALASVDCAITGQHEAGSHTVFFGAVRAVRLDPARGALAYFDRRFIHLR